MNPTVKVEITKKQGKGWSIHTEVKYPEFTHPAHTSSGGTSLAHALWSTLDIGERIKDIELLSLTVNGEPMSYATAYALIEKQLAGGCLDYTLPKYRKFLNVA